MSIEILHLRSLGSGADDLALPRNKRKEIERYLAYRHAGFSHSLALRYSRGR